MSASAPPIPASLFAVAIKDLPLGNVYAKVAELQNSIAHLRASNAEMAPYARDETDGICAEAMAENEEVMARMEERVRLCRAEVEGRGAVWSAHAIGADGMVEPGEEEGVVNGHATNGVPRSNGNTQAGSGRLTDEELRRQLEERMGVGEEEEDDDGEAGVHL